MAVVFCGYMLLCSGNCKFGNTYDIPLCLDIPGNGNSNRKKFLTQSQKMLLRVKMKENEQYKRLIRLIMVVVLIAAEMTMYYWIWLEYYNELMQIPYDVKGNYAIAFVYGLIIFLLLRIYGGFRIGYLKAVNLIYSHILSIVCANVIIYIQEILIIKRMPSPAPLIFLTVLESVLVVIWSMASTRIYRKLYPSKRVVLIYGNRPVSMLKQKLHTREDRFQVCESIHISEGKENIQKKD